MANQVPGQEKPYVAVIDLGSNSFELRVLKWQNGKWQRVKQSKEGVRLRLSLGQGGFLSPQGLARALDCFTDFGQLLHSWACDPPLIVGTATFREAKNIQGLLKGAQDRLGAEVTILSGAQEACLVYQGVQAQLPYPIRYSGSRRLVLDIGGGSCELALGQGDDPLMSASLPLGALGLQARFFPVTHPIQKAQFDRVYAHCLDALIPVADQMGAREGQEGFAASGCAQAMGQIASRYHWPYRIDLPMIERLEIMMYQAAALEELNIAGLSPSRLRVFPGALAIFKAVLVSFRLTQLNISAASLLDGLISATLNPTAGRFQHVPLHMPKPLPSSMSEYL